MSDSVPLMKGTLDVLVLKALSWDAMHGAEITTWLEERSGGSLGVEESALYYSLHRLEERGLVEAEWGLTDNNRRARYYRMTPAGRAWLRDEAARFVRYAETVTTVLNATARYA